MKAPVYVHKTQVSSVDKPESRVGNKPADPSKHCPLHGKPHPLMKCRGFREKSLEERKQLLKEHYICFRCCSSTEHLARNCSADVKCMECESTNHTTALHPGPATWKSNSSPPASEHSGEEDKAEAQEVTSRCTQVCGEGLSARACAKICLVSVYPTGHREESKRMYAILDDQSNRSLARSLMSLRSLGAPTNTLSRHVQGLKRQRGEEPSVTLSSHWTRNLAFLYLRFSNATKSLTIELRYLPRTPHATILT